MSWVAHRLRRAGEATEYATSEPLKSLEVYATDVGSASCQMLMERFMKSPKLRLRHSAERSVWRGSGVGPQLLGFNPATGRPSSQYICTWPRPSGQIIFLILLCLLY